MITLHFEEGDGYWQCFATTLALIVNIPKDLASHFSFTWGHLTPIILIYNKKCF